VLVVAAGCLPTIDLEPPPRCDVFDGGISTPTGRAVFVGREATVIASRRAPTCPPGDGVTALVRVTDPRSAVVEAAVEGPFVRGQFHGVEVRFTPTRPGPWRVDAVFEPALGRTVNEVMAIDVLEPGRRLASIPEGTPCVVEGATARGAMVCLSPQSASVSFWRAEQQLQAVPGVGFEVSGDAVFVFGAGQVERFVDVGGAFLRRVPDGLFVFDDTLRPIDAVAALDEDRLLVAANGKVHTVALTGGAFAVTAVQPLPIGACLGAPRLIPAGPDGFRLACTSRVEASTGATSARFCRSFGDEPDACFEVRGRLVGADADGVWVVEGQSVSRVTGPLERRTLDLPPGWSVMGVRRWAGSFHPLAVEPTGRTLQWRVGELPTLAGLDGAQQLLAAPANGMLVSGGGLRTFLFR
jgi:hypothetical protein